MYKILRKIYKKRHSLLNKFLPKNDPDFIIIGSQKSGTTSLHYYLNHHPYLVGSKPKEIHYFDKWINYGYDLNWYQNHFKTIPSKKVLFFESSPNYIYHKEVARLIKKYYPTIKLILILRNPIDRAYSAWNMYREMYEKNKPDFSKRKGRVPREPNYIYKYLMKDRNQFPDFSEAIQIELKLLNQKNVPKEPAILRRGFYVDQIRNYLQIFPRKNLYIIGFKDLTINTKKVLNNLDNFLGVPEYHYNQIKNEPKGQRKYQKKMESKEREFLIDFYHQKNIELFELLKFEPNW